MTTNLPMGGCPAVDRKVGITISGLEQWKDGIVSGATVKVEIIQHGQVIHSEVFSGKASAQFTRVVVIKATYGDLIAVHNRPDLPKLEVSADFIADDPGVIPPAVNVTGASILWGIDVKWQWPDCAGKQWYARVRADYKNGDALTSQGRRVNYPDCAYQVTGLPVGKEVVVTVTLHDGSGKQSKPVRIVSKSSDDANSILSGIYSVFDGQVYIEDALIDGAATYHLNCGVKEKTHEEKLRDDVAALVTEKIKQMLQPGGLLHGR